MLPINKDVLVVGGGVAGITAALSLAEQGFKVTIVERMRSLGGSADSFSRVSEGEDIGSQSGADRSSFES